MLFSEAFWFGAEPSCVLFKNVDGTNAVQQISRRCLRGAFRPLLCSVRFSAARGGEPCDDPSIGTVPEDGEIVIMSGGEKYHVDRGDEATTSRRMARNDVVICNGEAAVNKDKNGEKVGESDLLT